MTQTRKRVPKAVAKVPEPVVAQEAKNVTFPMYGPREERIWGLAKEMLLKRVGQSLPLSVAGIREIAAQAAQLHEEVYAPPF